ncbi:MAG: hypothetical protein BWY79_01418 [Actinobacteria bacterium ADurb.Bin444]|nr:MAG: hypothetical protein BWY79_01418 [Actinobacteria bacterium ADurb.Bin444]
MRTLWTSSRLGMLGLLRVVAVVIQKSGRALRGRTFTSYEILSRPMPVLPPYPGQFVEHAPQLVDELLGLALVGEDLLVELFSPGDQPGRVGG